MLSAKHLRVKVAGKKLAPKFIVPFQVREPVGDQAYRLALPSSYRIHDVFHVSKLEDYNSRGGEEIPEPQELIDGMEEWEVDPSDGQGASQWAGILSSRLERLGWEPAENLQNAQEAIATTSHSKTEQDELLEEPSGPSGQHESVAKRRRGSAQPR